jgi:hypothetical protein
VPQTITAGQTATAVVILTPVVGAAPWPTGAVTLTDELTGQSVQATMPGNFDTLFVPLTGLAPGVHNFNMSYAGDSNYVPAVQGQPYTTAGPYAITVVQPPTITLISAGAVTGSNSGGFTLTITVNNTGNATAPNLTLTGATLGTTSGAILPQVWGDLAAGGTATFTVTFPGSIGADGAHLAEKLAGSYTGGTFGASMRSVTLP